MNASTEISSAQKKITVLYKPFSVNDLLVQVRNALRKSAT